MTLFPTSTLGYFFEESRAKHVGDDDLTVLVVSEDGQEEHVPLHDGRNKKQRTTCRFWSNHKKLGAAAVVILALVGILILITTDLLTGHVEELQVHQVTLDATHSIPRVSADFQFAYSSRYSLVEPKALTCALPSGTIQVDIKRRNQETNWFTLEATCPSEHVESHEEVLWDWMTRPNHGMWNPSDIPCHVHATIVLGHVLPISPTIPMTLKQLVDQGAQWNANHDHSNENDYESHSDQSFFTVHRLDSNALQVGLRVKHLLQNSMCGSATHPVTSVQLQFPSIVVQVQPLDHSSPATTIVTNPVNTNLDCAGIHSSHELEDDLVLLTASCHDDDKCPWYVPMVQWMLQSAQKESPTVLQVDITSNDGSFLETLLGRSHQVTLESTTTNAYYNDLIQNPQDRKLEENFNLPLNNPETNCLHIMENTGNSGVALCYSLHIHHGMTLGINMTLYDYALSGWMETAWRYEHKNTLDIYLKEAYLELGSIEGPADIVNATGHVSMDWRTMTLDVGLENVGTYYPHKLSMVANGRSEQEGLLYLMDLTDVTLDWAETAHFSGATGTFVVDSQNYTGSAELSDPVLDSMVSVDAQLQVGLWALNISSQSNGKFSGEEAWDSNVLGTFRVNATQVQMHLDWNETISELRCQMMTAASADDKTNANELYSLGNSSCVVGTNTEQPTLWDAYFEATAITDAQSGDGAIVMAVNETSSDFRTKTMIDIRSTNAALSALETIALGNSTAHIGANAIWDGTVNMTSILSNNSTIMLDVKEAVTALEMKSTSVTEIVSNIFGTTLLASGDNLLLFNEGKYWDASMALEYSADGSKESMSMSFNESVADMIMSAAGSNMVSDSVGIVGYVLDYLRLKLAETQWLDATGRLSINRDDTFVQFSMEDTGDYNLLGDMSLNWNVFDTGFVVEMPTVIIKSGEEVWLDMIAMQFFENGGTGSLLMVSAPEVIIDLGAIAKYDFVGDPNQWSIHARDLKVAINGTTMMDVQLLWELSLANQSMVLEAQGITALDFDTRIKTTVINEPNKWGILDETYIRWGPDVLLDSFMDGELAIVDDTSGEFASAHYIGNTDFIAKLDVTTEPEALLQMDVGMIFAYMNSNKAISDDAFEYVYYVHRSIYNQSVSMLMDRLHMEWNDTVLVTMGAIRTVVEEEEEEVVVVDLTTAAPPPDDVGEDVNATDPEEAAKESDAATPPPEATENPGITTAPNATTTPESTPSPAPETTTAPDEAPSEAPAASGARPSSGILATTLMGLLLMAMMW